MKKIFISFLGTNNYIPCNYYFGSKKIENVEFIQEALIKIFFEPFDNNSFLLFFLTSKAKEVNWEKLKQRLSKYPSNQICEIDIPDGRTEEEIWEIFEKLYDNIPYNSDIIFDITHAFRSIPMLAISLLNYAKVMKRINVKGIYYGAVETLGNRQTIENMPLEKRDAPIFNLTQFNELIEWSNGAYEFTKYGITTKLKELVNNRIKPILAKTKGKDSVAKNLRFISNELERISFAFSTVRGNEIYKNIKFSEIETAFDEIYDQIEIKPYKPLIEKIKNKLSGFKNNNIKNLFYAANFCYEHNLIQQSITILQEAIITYFCEQFNFDYKKRKHRELISQIFHIKAKNIPENEWKPPAKDDVQLTEKLLIQVNNEFAKMFIELSDLRNDINHSGFLDSSRSYNKFYTKIKEIYEKVMNHLFD